MNWIILLSLCLTWEGDSQLKTCLDYISMCHVARTIFVVVKICRIFQPTVGSTVFRQLDLGYICVYV